MKKIDLGQTIGILANIGVIAGIAFLGLELRQNNDLQRAEAQRARAALGGANYELVAVNPELASTVLRDFQGEPLTGVEMTQVEAFWTRAVINNELTYLQGLQDDLPKMRQRMRRYYASSPALRRVWEHSDEFDDGFANWFNSNVVNGQ